MLQTFAPPMRRPTVPLLTLALLCCVLQTTPVVAGHYDVAYPGGSCTTSKPGYSNTRGYVMQSNGTWGQGDYQQITGSSGTVTISASGTITATFTWNTDGDPN